MAASEDDERVIFTLPPAGSRWRDARAALRHARKRLGDPAWRKPAGWVWHHATRDHVELVPALLHAQLDHVSDYPSTVAVRPRGNHSIKDARLLEDPGGGGTPADGSVAPAGGEAEEEVDFVLGEQRDDDLDVASFLAIYQGRLPPACVPFALDPFGNLFCSVRDAEGRPPSIWLWLHDAEDDTAGAMPRVDSPAWRRLADAMEGFTGAAR